MFSVSDLSMNAVCKQSGIYPLEGLNEEHLSFLVKSLTRDHPALKAMFPKFFLK